MPVDPDGHRAGGTPRVSAELLERESALTAIEGTLAAASRGESRALLLIGNAGMGKTRLYEAGLETARGRGMRVLRAAGAELEQNLSFGVAGQLVRSLLGDLTDQERRTLLAHSPAPLLELERVEETSQRRSGDEHLAISHGVFTVIAAAVEGSAALVAVDDLHWCDSASAELLLYLLHRLDELQLALIMTRRPAIEEQPADPLTHLSAHPRVRVEHLAPLGSEAVHELLERALGRPADPMLVEVCLEATAGNPFFLQALLHALAEERELTVEQLTERTRSLVPEAVSRTLRVRVGRVGHDAAALARAVAILGDDVPLRHAAALAELTIAQASTAADALAAADVLLATEPLRFVHPLVRTAVEQDIPASQRASRHLDAARLLYAEGTGVERVAAHLLLGRAEGDPWVVDRLRAAARDARASSAPQSALRYLERALAEPPGAEQRADVLAELGVAEAALGTPQAAQHLADAIAEVPEPGRRAELALELGRAYATHGDQAAAASAFDRGLHDLGAAPGAVSDLELRDQLEAGFIASATMIPALRPSAATQAARWLRDAAGAPATQGERLLIAHLAVEGAYRGEPAEKVIELAERAWDRGRMLEQAASQWIGWRLVANALCCAGGLERAAEVCEAAIQDAGRRNSPLDFATATFTRASPRLLQGRINDALVDLEATRDARRYGWSQFPRAAAAKYALCLVETGELETAEAVLTEDAPLERPSDLEDAMRLVALAEVRRAQGRLEEALAGAEAAGQAAEQTIPFFDYCRWRTTAAQAALALGNRDRAVELAAGMLSRAQRTRVVEHQIEALRVSAMCQGGSAGLGKLREAVELGRSLPPRLEMIRSLLELGAALRRANERAAARPYLQEAADRARTGGARVLSERARTELSASGGRPRRQALLSGPASLTPSERRIAELAAGGHSNREIAATLFVTPKTVEYHLRNAYRKLAIQTRRQLADALTRESA